MALILVAIIVILWMILRKNNRVSKFDQDPTIKEIGRVKKELSQSGTQNAMVFYDRDLENQIRVDPIIKEDRTLSTASRFVRSSGGLDRLSKDTEDPPHTEWMKNPIDKQVYGLQN